MKYLLKFLFVLILTISLESLSNNNLGIYIHIPFCRRRCFYCDFPIQIIGNRKSTIEQSSLDYTQLLLHDIQLTCDQPNDVEETCLQSNESDHFRLVDSIYFGGGTPSLLHPICKIIIINNNILYKLYKL
jgi:oxygen-independent coproporphyrinogen-3 oxidase